MNSLPGNFRQFSLWGTSKSCLGLKKNPAAVWYEQARPAICRIFRDCFAILGLLRRPTPDSHAFSTKHGCSPRSRNDGFGRQWCFSTIANNQKIRIELARIRIFLVLAYFWSTVQVKPIQSTGGNNKDRQDKLHRPPKVYAQLYYESLQKIARLYMDDGFHLW